MTVSSDVDICNLALDLLNQKSITSIEIPSTSTEEACARWYDQTRQQALRRHPWNFAGKRVILAPNATDPEFGWSKAFDLPSDYIRIMHIGDSVLIHDNPLPTSQFSIEGNQVLLGGITGVESSQLRLVYVSDFKNVTKMDANFIDYFTVMLARNLAYKFTNSNSTIERTDSLMKKAEEVARSMDGQENPPIRVERSRNRRARGRLSSTRNLDGVIAF